MAEHMGDIWACCRCRHVYWPGGQYKRALSNMEEKRGVTAPAQVSVEGRACVDGSGLDSVMVT